MPYAEETPESIENSFNMGCPVSLEAKISPQLDKGEPCALAVEHPC